MAEFLQGDKLNAQIGDIFKDCGKQLIIISPFIKLYSRYKDILKSKISSHKLEITIVFGKNEEKIFKSFNSEDFQFLKKFPNIKIKYEKRLHAKYYANENAAILSSMNLYEYSQNNNIEFGIFTKSTFLNDLTSNFTSNSLDFDAFNYFQEVIKNSETLYHKKPIYKEGFLGVTKDYSHSVIEKDDLTHRLQKTSPKKNSSPFYQTNTHTQPNKTGYCIRTGEEIEFNPKKPFSDKAFKQWNRFKDKNYSEKYCHYSGEKSNGETSYNRPILRKYWKKATKQ